MIKVRSRSPSETKLLAMALAKKLRGGEILALRGTLGSGKTTFIKGLARGLKIRETVASPTFIIVSPHSIPGRREQTFLHLDLHRLKSERELGELGFPEILQNSRFIVAIEWPETAEKFLPKRTLHLQFRHGRKPTDRIINIL